MSQPFIAEIRIFAGNFAPSGWAFCNGQLLPIAQNTALFALVGTTYGGDGRTNFGLPNLQGRAPMHPGSGPGLTTRRLGEVGGSTTVTLTEAQMPNHSHGMQAFGGSGNEDDVSSAAILASSPGGNIYGIATNLSDLAAAGLTPAGASQPHNNLQPYLGLSFIIALLGLFPTRN